MNADLAPVALFVYNRPQHLKKTIDALVKNDYAAESVLYIFSDAPKTKDDIPKVSEVRAYIAGICGFKRIEIHEQNENIGLAQSIISGVSSLCCQYGKVIVLEDDLETSQFFLKFMNDALIFYEKSPQVMHISGFRYPVDSFERGETFFLRIPLCWGWATWDRAWKSYKKDLALMTKFNKKDIYQFNFDNSYPFWLQLKLNKKKKINTWFIFWYANLFLKNGLTLFPARSLVQNIGMDDSGTNSGYSESYNVSLSNTPINLTEINIAEDSVAYEYHRQFFKRIHLSILIRIINKIKIFSCRVNA